MHRKQRKHKNTIFLVLGIIAAVLMTRIDFLHQILMGFNELNYFGAFLAGMLFTSTFTMASGALIILNLSGILNPVWLVIAGGMGALVADLIIFKFIKNKVADEMIPIFKEIGGSHFRKLMHSKLFAWTLPVLGALLIASPLPDEVGLSLLGMAEMKTFKFMTISFCSHLVGMSLVVGSKLI